MAWFTNGLRTKRSLLMLQRASIAAFFILGVILSQQIYANRLVKDNTTRNVSGKVSDSRDRPLGGARVYFIPATEINTSNISPQDILDGSAEDRDEPLEDIVRTRGSTLISARTDPSGRFKVRLEREKEYFTFSDPGPENSQFLPGGSTSRVAFSPKGTQRLKIVMSYDVPADATYIGSSACTTCHSIDSYKQHAHRLGLLVPGKTGGHQSFEWHTDANTAFTAKFTEATSHTDSGVKTLFFQNYDSSRGFDKWQVFEDAADSGSGTVYAKVYLWKNGANYKVTIKNALNASDPLSPLTLDIPLLYGGSVYKQRLLVAPAGRKGRYPFLQFQAFSSEISMGSNAYYARDRTVFQDYHMDWFFKAGTDGVMGTSDDVLSLPSANKTFEGNCAGCHFTGHRQWKDETTGEILADAVNEGNGAFDIDGDGTNDEINIGCEVCHGPGSKHRDATLEGLAAQGRKRIESLGKYIVTPENLSAARETLICGRCHDRQLGNSALNISDEPLNTNGQMPPPGISRKDMLASYVTRKSLALGDYHANGIHAAKHHPQYPDFLRSKHSRNSRELLTCTTCHSPHGPGDAANRYFLKYDPNNADSKLCQRCHALNIEDHSTEKTGDPMIGSDMTCNQCHMPRTAKSGAGRPGKILRPLTGTSADEGIMYWENDISSHLMKVPNKYDSGVKGKLPGKAMPIPFTHSCGQCHNAYGL